MFALSSRAAARLAPRAVPRAFLSSAPPTVASQCCTITFVDHAGTRVAVPGLIGTTLYDCATSHKIDLGPATTGAVVERVNSERWTEDLYGEGANSGFDHVKIPEKWQPFLPKMDEMEEMMLEQYWEEEDLTPGASRLASQVAIVKEMEGMTVYIPDGLVSDDHADQ
jgi:hypothetical protein